ncbi:MAG: response regulator [Cyanobacteriota bacterium]|nr:response regulator [Cyanobacteriota bacterium]
MDDKWTNRQLPIQLLSPLGFQLQEACNGMEGQETQEAWQPHLIFMDLRMPGMNGWEATKQIKGKNEGQATAMIALTGSNLEEEEEKGSAFCVGCDDVIRKPFRQAEIFDTIEKYLGVGYVCEQPSNSLSQELQTKMQETLTPELLEARTAPIFANLERDSIRINLEEIYNSSEEIRAYNSDAADACGALADNFEYSQILNLIQLAKKKHD